MLVVDLQHDQVILKSVHKHQYTRYTKTPQTTDNMTDYGNRGRQLLLDLKNSAFLPAYNEELVRITLHECNLHYDELSDLHNATTASRDSLAASSSTTTGGISKDTARTKEPPIEYSPAMTLHAAALERNKRCLLAYHSYRLDKLRDMRRETANAVLPTEVSS